MAFTMINRSALPVSARGQAATDPKVSIRENGQIAFNKLATTALGSPTHLVLAFDDTTRKLTFRPYTSGVTALPKGVTKKDEYEANLFPLSYGKEKVSDTPYFAGSGLCKQLKYDYQTSGNQNFIPEVGGKNNDSLTIVLPEGTLEAKPKQERKRKDPATSNGPVKSVPVAKGAAVEDLDEAEEEFDVTA